MAANKLSLLHYTHTISVSTQQGLHYWKQGALRLAHTGRIITRLKLLLVNTHMPTICFPSLVLWIRSKIRMQQTLTRKLLQLRIYVWRLFFLFQCKLYLWMCYRELYSLQGFEKSFHLDNNSPETTLLEPAKVKLKIVAAAATSRAHLHCQHKKNKNGCPLVPEQLL